MESVCHLCARPTPNIICTECQRQLMADLELVEWLTAELEIAVTRQDVMGDRWRDGGRSSETPLPYNVRASAVADRLTDALQACVRAMHTELHLALPADTETLAAWLLRHLMAFPTWVSAAEHCQRIGNTVTDAAQAIDRSPPKSVYAAPCDVTGCPGELWTIIGDAEYVSCRRCGVVVSRQQAQERADREIYGSIFPAQDIALIASLRLKRKVTSDMVHSMTRRKNRPLESRGRTLDGRPLYSPADVIARLKAA